ncbi:DUF4367 domain-containing protein (plasmid) [Brevibacillus sp. M2.1A]|uniref:DUF4367 domain-containing protein n=1 Tax=Brevibacillus sp. M2.1A TaxID=2738980 RepID=UPI00156AED60|nr:DUF4367 domain-containing protein [Brevibacillus sp. M2.1A]MCC8438714.1 DUF4367 domain-containing protein [Brevibacillus sp. M2.1A]
MKKGVIITGALALMTIIPSAYAMSSGGQHTEISDHHIVSKPVVIPLEKLSKHGFAASLDADAPIELPDGYKLSEAIYNEPPKKFGNGVAPNVEEQKEIVLKYVNENNNEDWFEHTVKKGRISLGDEGVKPIEIQGVEGEILEMPDQKIIVLSWHKDGVSHYILSKGDLGKDDLIKVAESVRD